MGSNFFEGMTVKRCACGFLIAMCTLTILVVVFLGLQWAVQKFLSFISGSDGMSNAVTGGNNPQWQHQMGDAGWGGSLGSTYRMTDGRVYGASNSGWAHDPTESPKLMNVCGQLDPATFIETNTLVDLQAVDPKVPGELAASKALDDVSLMRIMSQGGV